MRYQFSMSAPPAIGDVIPNTGKFTQMQANALTQALSTNSPSGTATVTLTSASPHTQILATNQALTIVLPDATTLNIGDEYEIICLSSSGTIAVQDFTTYAIYSVASTQTCRLKLRANGSSSGTWAITAIVPASSGSYLQSVSPIGSSPNANGATVTGRFLSLQPASASYGGVVTTSAQTFAGDKTFTGNVSSNRFIPTVNREVLSSNKTIASTAPQYQFLDPSGSNRDVTLPSSVSNMLFIIKNIGTSGTVLTVKDSSGTAISNGVLANGITMGFYYDGSVWQIV